MNIVSRYEWGIDLPSGRNQGEPGDTAKLVGFVAGKDIYPAHKEDGRFTTGCSEFTINLAADNYGVLLRRTVDYSFDCS